MHNILSIFQIVISVLLVVSIIMQQRGAGSSGFLGGGGGGSYHTKRGLEKILFTSTIVLAVLFILSTLLALLIK